MDRLFCVEVNDVARWTSASHFMMASRSVQSCGMTGASLRQLEAQ